MVEVSKCHVLSSRNLLSNFPTDIIFALILSIPLSTRIPIPSSNTQPIPIIPPSTFHANRPIFPIPLQPPRQLHAPKPRKAHRRCGARAQHAIHHRAHIHVATHARPLARQYGVRVPADAQPQRQAIPNNDLGVAGRVRDAVRGGGVDGAGCDGAGRGVDEHVEVVRDVQVAELEGAGQGDDERGEAAALGAHGAALLRDSVDAVFAAVAIGGLRERVRGDAACQGRVVVDVEFEQVEQGVRDEVDGAVHVCGRKQGSAFV